jgi:hypothetical protein
MGWTAEVFANRQLAFLDHVLVVVDGETAAAVIESESLLGLARLKVATVQADGESWTGRYLFGRQTYVEVFGPGDYEDGAPGATGLGLSTRTRGELDVLVERAAAAGSELKTGRRTAEADGDAVPWFDYAEPDASDPTFSIWVMEFLSEPDDLARRESGFLEFTGGARSGPFIGEVAEVELAAPAEDVALARPVLQAAGFTLTGTSDGLVARDGTTTIWLHVTSRDDARVRRIAFTLTGSSDRTPTERIGRSTLTVGPGSRADWTFDPCVR